MRILIVEPGGASQGRGNAVTVARWARGLRRAGHEVTVSSVESLGRPDPDPPPDIVHAHHAVKAGLAAARLARKLRRPLVISMGGTDVNRSGEATADPRGLPALRQAAAILGPFPEEADRLPEVALVERFRCVRRGVELPAEAAPARGAGTLRLACVGAVRPVKRQLEAVRLVENLRSMGLAAGLLLVGPMLDDQYALQLRSRIADLAWCQMREAVAHADMGSIHAGTDVSVNLSLSEGASNALLEAWSYGVPVAAAAVPGNLEMLAPAQDSIAHLLRTGADLSPADAAWFAKAGTAGVTTRSSTARAARAHVRQRHDPAEELRELLGAYEEVLAGGN